jgi:hypothetical protein
MRQLFIKRVLQIRGTFGKAKPCRRYFQKTTDNLWALSEFGK